MVGFSVDDREPVSAGAGEIPLTDRPLNTPAFVDHLDQQAIVVERRSQRDRAAAVDDGVADELADQQPRGAELVSGDRRRQPVHE